MRCTLRVFHFSIRPPPDTVHTRLFLTVALTFSLLSSQRPSDTVHSGSLPFLRRLDGQLGRLRLAGGLFPPLHPASGRHGTHLMGLDGRVDLAIVTLLPEAVRYGTLWESSIYSPS
jgi:hypothetical protein